MHLKTLAAGALCQLCTAEPDVGALAMHLNLAPALLRAASSDVSTVYLKAQFDLGLAEYFNILQIGSRALPLSVSFFFGHGLLDGWFDAMATSLENGVV